MATEFDMTQAAASVYAESLLQLATEAGQVDSVGEELADLGKLWREDPGFAGLMSSAAIDDDARAMSIRKIFGAGRVSDLVFRFLMVLNKKRRSMILPAICASYRRLMDRQRGRSEVLVRSAVPLEDDQRDKLKSEIKRLTGLDAVLVEQVEPELLGGLTVQVADRIYDTSIRRRLRDMQGALASAIERHLLSGDNKFVTEG